jgi:L,D-transpeptidase ErfK/SrfK
MSVMTKKHEARMNNSNTKIPSRRALLFGATAATLFAPSILRAQTQQAPVDRNIAAFRVHEWRDHFDSLGVGAILADTKSMFLQHWTPDGDMRIYPTSVPLSDDLTRTGFTEVIDKRVAPSWAPTPAMRERNPEWPAFIPGGDPLNPMGSHALYLSWQFYRIHGTQDTRKIGRKSSNGCIGLYNEQIAEVYDRAPVGTKVRLI